jgi:lipopolysaccharide transport system ATP-binding protein
MNDIAIKVENLSKYYRLGVEESSRDSMVDSMLGILRSPLKNYRKYRSLFDFSDIDSNPENILKALNDVSFEVRSGERIGIIGGNGAGKSTLLKVLSKITPPSTGTATIKGRVSSLLEVGTGFHPELTGRENVYLNGTILGMSKKEVDRKYDEIVAFSGTEKFLETPVKRYSSGMRVRLAFAVAAHLEPEILIVDEVLAVGDAEFQNKCLNKMENVAKGGRTVLFVSHNMGAITQLCERAIWLEGGCLRQEGGAEEVVSTYLSAGTTGHSVWEPDAETESSKSGIIIHRAKLTNPKDNSLSVLSDYDQPLRLDIKYELKRASRNVQILYRVIDMKGNTIYTSIDTDKPDTHGQTREEGIYISSSILSSHLRPGRYNLSIGTRDGPRRLDLYENVLTFDITSVGCNLFPLNRAGLTMPTLEWQIKSLSNE